MKKLLALWMAVLVLMTGCGQKNTAQNEPSNKNEVQASEAGEISRYQTTFYDTFDTVVSAIVYASSEEEANAYFETIHKRYQELDHLYSSFKNYDGIVNVKSVNDQAGKGKVGKKGVVREPEIHLEVLENYVENAHAAGFKVLDVTFSPIKGPEGNIEFLGYLAKQGEEHIPDLAEVVRQAHEELDS